MIKTNEYNFRVRLDCKREKAVLDRLREVGAIGQNSEFLRDMIKQQAGKSLPLHEFIAFYPEDARMIMAAKNPEMSMRELDAAIESYKRVAQQKELAAKPKGDSFAAPIILTPISILRSTQTN